MGYFIFKNRNSNDFGPVERTKMLMRNKQTLNITNIPFSTPVVSWGGHETGTIQFTIGIRNINDTDKVDDLLGWLTGEGPLITSTDPKKYMWAYCNTEILPNPIGGRLATASVTFTVEPYRYAIDNPEEKLDMQPDPKSDNPNLRICKVENTGNTQCEPTFRIIGNGTIELWLNHLKMTIQNVSGGIIVDVPTLRVKDLNGNVILNRTIGDPTQYLLNPGENLFEYIGATEAYLKKNTRWL